MDARFLRQDVPLVAYVSNSRRQCWSRCPATVP